MTVSEESGGVSTPIIREQDCAKGTKSFAPLDVTCLPPIEDIIKEFPPGGLTPAGILQLARKLKINNSNSFVFEQVLARLCSTQRVFLLKPLRERPTQKDIEELYNDARVPPKAQEENKKCTAASLILKNATITWGHMPELIREASQDRPRTVYRYFSERSITWSAYVTRQDLYIHTDVGDPTLHEDAAFEALHPFSIQRDVTLHRILRQLSWNTKLNPSSLVSTTDDLCEAKQAIEKHYQGGDARRTWARLAIAEIDLSDLRPVTVHAKMEETIEVTLPPPPGKKRRTKRTDDEHRDVQFRIWMHDDAFEGCDESGSMTFRQLDARNPEVWLSIRELRNCSLKLAASAAHDHEWLAGGKILKKRIRKVIPYDGKQWHDTPAPVRMLCNGKEAWTWTWEKSMWEEVRRPDDDAEDVSPEEAAVSSAPESGTTLKEPFGTQTLAQVGAGAEDVALKGMVKLADFSDEDDAFDMSLAPELRSDISDRRKTSSTKRSKGSDIGDRNKRARVESCGLPGHLCTDWCSYGYWNSDPEYDLAWRDQLKSQE